jgi:P-type conjugative transfer protein TrbJ
MRRALITITAAVLAASAWTGARRTAAKGLALCLAIIAWMAGPSARAQWAVIDGSNLLQNTTTALNSVRSVAQQISAYNLQLQQYANEMKQATGLADIARVYQQFQQTQQQLQQLYGQFGNGGSLQNYLQQFQSVNYWSQVPPGNYSQAANASLNQNSQTQKDYNDGWAKGLAQHQQLLAQDAAALERAQTNANTAEGQMQAIQASAQINAAVAQQLLEIHALMVQQQEALQARQASQVNQEAMAKAYNDKLTGAGTTYTAHDGKVWMP